ncbi:hypothetical protein Droror1_Dr00026121 [Drosera rotundifolia]
MERFRRRRSSSRDSSPSKRSGGIGGGSGVDRSSDEKSALDERSLKGRAQGKKEDFVQKMGSNSSSRSNSLTTEEDLLTLRLGQHTSGLLTGTVMKKLLADEMSREIESRRRPSIVARLMGLDVLPPTQQDSDKHDKRVAGLHRGGDSYRSQTHRSSREQHQFKDVYEVAEHSKVLHECRRSQVSFSGKNGQADLAYVRERFIDGNRPSLYEKFRDTKEFRDALEVLEADEDLMMKFLDTPDSLFAQHLHHLRDAHAHHLGNARGLKSSALKHNINAIEFQSGREASHKIDVSFSNKHRDGLHSHSCSKPSSKSCKLSYFPTEITDRSGAIPTKIVVLKPNTAKLENCGKHDSSLDHLSHLEVRKEKHSLKRGDEFWHRKYFPDGSDTSGLDCRESRQLAREVTRQVKQKLGDGSFNISLNGYKGYSADESSHDLSGNDSSYESEAANVFSKMPLHWRSHDEASSSRYAESSVNREAKKRLSERWKMTRRSQASGIVNGSTLGEMLAIPELDARLSNMEATISHDGFYRFARRDSTGDSMVPMGISSRDAWKYDPLRKLSRSRSLPASSDYLGSPTNWRREALVAERFLVPKEHSGRPRNKAVTRSGSIRTSNKRSGTVYRHNEEIREAVKVHRGMSQKEDNWEDSNSPEVKAVISETPAGLIAPSIIVDEVVDLDPENLLQSLTCSDEQIPIPEIPGDVPVQDQICRSESQKLLHEVPSKSCQTEDSAYSQCPASELEIPLATEEKQPSPNSILEGSFVKDLSSGSKCFERVNSGLSGLRMQLQLLKQESEAYDEGSLHVPSEDDVGKMSNALPESRGLLDEESCASSYFLDVLADSGFDHSDLEMLKSTWDSIGCLVAPWVFEKLEKSFSAQSISSRIDRKLLFDRINSGIPEILEKVSDPCPWVTYGKRITYPQWEDMIKAELRQLLKEQEVVDVERTFLHEQVLESDLKWMNLGDHIDGVAREIEQVMIDELMADFVTM